MKISEPKRWWFPVSLLAAMLTTGVIRFLVCFTGMLINADPGDISVSSVLFLVGAVAGWGTIVFPSGFFGLLIWSTKAFSHPVIAPLLILVGWVSYLTLILTGMAKRSKPILIVLVVILLANIVGCQSFHILGEFRLTD